MIDHVGFAVSDLARSRAFYDAARAPVGFSVIIEVGPDKTESGFDPDGINIEAVCHQPA